MVRYSVNILQRVVRNINYGKGRMFTSSALGIELCNLTNKFIWAKKIVLCYTVVTKLQKRNTFKYRIFGMQVFLRCGEVDLKCLQWKCIDLCGCFFYPEILHSCDGYWKFNLINISKTFGYKGERKKSILLKKALWLEWQLIFKRENVK